MISVFQLMVAKERSAVLAFSSEQVSTCPRLFQLRDADRGAQLLQNTQSIVQGPREMSRGLECMHWFSLVNKTTVDQSYCTLINHGSW